MEGTFSCCWKLLCSEWCRLQLQSSHQSASFTKPAWQLPHKSGLSICLALLHVNLLVFPNLASALLKAASAVRLHILVGPELPSCHCLDVQSWHFVRPHHLHELLVTAENGSYGHRLTARAGLVQPTNLKPASAWHVCRQCWRPGVHVVATTITTLISWLEKPQLHSPNPNLLILRRPQSQSSHHRWHQRPAQ